MPEMLNLETVLQKQSKKVFKKKKSTWNQCLEESQRKSGWDYFVWTDSFPPSHFFLFRKILLPTEIMDIEIQNFPKW